MVLPGEVPVELGDVGSDVGGVAHRVRQLVRRRGVAGRSGQVPLEAAADRVRRRVDDERCAVLRHAEALDVVVGILVELADPDRERTTAERVRELLDDLQVAGGQQRGIGPPRVDRERFAARCRGLAEVPPECGDEQEEDERADPAEGVVHQSPSCSMSPITSGTLRHTVAPLAPCRRTSTRSGGSERAAPLPSWTRRLPSGSTPRSRPSCQRDPFRNRTRSPACSPRPGRRSASATALSGRRARSALAPGGGACRPTSGRCR